MDHEAHPPLLFSQSLLSSLDGVRSEVSAYQEKVQRLGEVQVEVVQKAGASLEQGITACEYR